MEKVEIIERFLAPRNTGSGDGYGSGSGSGDGYGDGYGSGSGSGDGYGSGSGSGDGYDVKAYNGAAVYIVDSVQTLIYRIRGNVARGEILNGDLTTTPCYVVKQDDHFAHGETLHAAREALLEKLFDDMPEDARLDAFVKAHKPGESYPNTDFFAWHHRLTGSCEMGRRQFARDHGIDVEHGSMTPETFIALTESSYGGAAIRKLKPHYGLQ
jgi:hypothetical protein